MAKLSHTNLWLHNMLLSEGACSHEHVEEVVHDVLGDTTISGSTWDQYISESHIFIIDASGTIVHCAEIDWDLWRWVEEQEADICEKL